MPDTAEQPDAEQAILPFVEGWFSGAEITAAADLFTEDLVEMLAEAGLLHNPGQVEYEYGAERGDGRMARYDRRPSHCTHKRTVTYGPWLPERPDTQP